MKLGWIGWIDLIKGCFLGIGRGMRSTECHSSYGFCLAGGKKGSEVAYGGDQGSTEHRTLTPETASCFLLTVNNGFL